MRLKEKLNTMIIPIQLNSEQYALICAKADHDNCKREEIIQEAVEIYIEQTMGEKVILDIDSMVEGFQIYCNEGIDSDELRFFWEQNKVK